MGNSVVRHHVTRLVRESYRLHEEMFNSGLDIVVIARTNAAAAKYSDIESALLHVSKLHKNVLNNRVINLWWKSFYWGWFYFTGSTCRRLNPQNVLISLPAHSMGLRQLRDLDLWRAVSLLYGEYFGAILFPKEAMIRFRQKKVLRLFINFKFYFNFKKF